MSDTHDSEKVQAELFGGATDEQLQLDRRTYQRLITMSHINATPARCVVADKPVVLCWIRGIAKGVEMIDHPDHPETTFKALAGEFEARVYKGPDPDPETAEVELFYGGLCFLPGGFHEACLSRMSEMDADVLTTQGLPFSIEFSAEPQTGKGQYRYVGRNMMRVPVASDRLALLGVEGVNVRSRFKALALAPAKKAAE